MSNRHGFNTSDLPPGISYTLVYSRMGMGWSFERAISVPAKAVPRKKTFAERMERYPAKREAIRLRNEQRTLAEKLAWNAKAEAEKAAAEEWRKAQALPWEHVGYVVARPKKEMIPKRHASAADDTSPAHIRILRAKLCDGFIKMGYLDQGLMTKLKEYADECSAAKSHSAGVSGEPSIANYRPGSNPARNDSDRNDHQADELRN